MSKSEQLRIAVVSSTCPPKGGGIAAAHCELAKLLARRWEVRVFAYADPDQKHEGHIERRNTPAWLGKVLYWLGRRYVRRYNPQGCAVAVPRILRASCGAWRLSRPLRQFRPDVLIVPDHYLPLYWLRPPGGCKTIWFSNHNYLRFRGNPLLGASDWADTDIARSMERRALRKAQAAICPCDYMIREFKRAYTTGIPIFKIPNWFDVEAIQSIPPSTFREEKGWGRDLPVVYIPSAGSEFKGKRYVFEIIRRLSRMRNGSVRFLLSGAFPEDLQMELRTAGLLDKVHVPGHVAWSEILGCVKACDAGVSPTLIENFSMAIIEAMAMGVPVVAFDTGGNREIISHGQSGWIVPYLDVDALVERALQCLQNPGQRAEMSRAAAAGMSQLLAPDRLLALYEDLFRQLQLASRLSA